MNTAEDIAKKHFPCTCGEIYLSRNLTAPDCPYHSFDWESAMQEVAELAFDAGVTYAEDRINSRMVNWPESEPNYNDETSEERRDKAIEQQKLK